MLCNPTPFIVAPSHTNRYGHSHENVNHDRKLRLVKKGNPAEMKRIWHRCEHEEASVPIAGSPRFFNVYCWIFLVLTFKICSRSSFKLFIVYFFHTNASIFQHLALIAEKMPNFSGCAVSDRSFGHSISSLW